MNEYIKPVLILFVICLVSATLLAATFAYTSPKIEENLKKATEEALREVLPKAQDFKDAAQNKPNYVFIMEEGGQMLVHP